MNGIDEQPTDYVSTVGNEPASVSEFIDDSAIDGEDELEWARRLA